MSSLKAFANREPPTNNIEAYTIKCQSRGLLFVLRSPVELYGSDQLYASEFLKLSNQSPRLLGRSAHTGEIRCGG
jgi:hypothetical protein